ncbi:MAG: DUF4838 domain-containing protein [Ruminococcaceae bacterium]|nr:DUF4838 domain-containing protein [Oscillospiraceae bacterium]
MKRIIALMLSLLLLSPYLISCDTTSTDETTGTEETVETAANTGDTHTNSDNITEDGKATSHIVVAEGADKLLAYAAEELRYHIEKVSGANLPVVTEANDDSTAIVIATPESCPELEKLFPEDLAWLTTLTEEGTVKRYGSDGFAIRRIGGVIYIFGATAKGALNGVYDFLEENTGMLWISTVEEVGLVFEETPTITVKKTDYREKSPFTYRGYSLWGGEGCLTTEALYSRNKLNASLFPMDQPLYPKQQASVGITGIMLGHDLQEWIMSSPIYDPECTEYWNELEDGVPVPVDEAMRLKQVNIWSDLVIDTIAAGVIAHLDANDVDNVSISVEDNDDCKNYPEIGLPFEYAPGEFVNPGDDDYISTVFFTFLNKIAAQVKEKHPGVIINTLAYWPVESPSRCTLDDSIRLIFAPITKDETASITDPENDNNATIFGHLEGWKPITREIIFYDYYFCHNALADYERPIWYDMQKDMIYYAENGYLGPMPQGVLDGDFPYEGWGNNPYKDQARTKHEVWMMSGMSIWIYHKLCWNPYEDMDALIVEYCNKVYGAASEEMQEYYNLIYTGWEEGESENIIWNFKIDLQFYLDSFIYVVDLEDDIKNALLRAYEAADTDAAKERILYIKERFDLHFPE